MYSYSVHVSSCKLVNICISIAFVWNDNCKNKDPLTEKKKKLFFEVKSHCVALAGLELVPGRPGTYRDP